GGRGDGRCPGSGMRQLALAMTTRCSRPATSRAVNMSTSRWREPTINSTWGRLVSVHVHRAAENALGGAGLAGDVRTPQGDATVGRQHDGRLAATQLDLLVRRQDQTAPIHP